MLICLSELWPLLLVPGHILRAGNGWWKVHKVLYIPLTSGSKREKRANPLSEVASWPDFLFSALLCLPQGWKGLPEEMNFAGIETTFLCLPTKNIEWSCNQLRENFLSKEKFHFKYMLWPHSKLNAKRKAGGLPVHNLATVTTILRLVPALINKLINQSINRCTPS